jgi:hypothetical protein
MRMSLRKAAAGQPEQRDKKNAKQRGHARTIARTAAQT